MSVHRRFSGDCFRVFEFGRAVGTRFTCRLNRGALYPGSSGTVFEAYWHPAGGSVVLLGQGSLACLTAAPSIPVVTAVQLEHLPALPRMRHTRGMDLVLAISEGYHCTDPGSVRLGSTTHAGDFLSLIVQPGTHPSVHLSGSDARVCARGRPLKLRWHDMASWSIYPIAYPTYVKQRGQYYVIPRIRPFSAESTLRGSLLDLVSL